MTRSAGGRQPCLGGSLCSGLGWVGFDPANRICPTERYVRLACGLDCRERRADTGTAAAGEEQLDGRRGGGQQQQ